MFKEKDKKMLAMFYYSLVELKLLENATCFK